MADAQDLHQIEYRHHPTRDLSPVATSMPSPESLRAWDSLIRAWVRHPHADRLSESVCYQLLGNGRAALAWRYWDQRAAERADGTRGRPLVSRILVGQAAVLTPQVAVVLCQAGPTAGTVGVLPGEVPDDGSLPTVNGAVLEALVRVMTPALDQNAAGQTGLQAVVAAALADPHAALAISLRDTVISKPLRDGVQGPLLWGLARIAVPLLAAVGRDWSFSTFEPPLGELDPGSLPGIVFRQAQDGTQGPPTRWRKEARVRPLDPNALDSDSPYADWVEPAGWLVDEFRERGGDWLGDFIAGCCGSERSLQVRLERVRDELRKMESPVVISGEPARFVSLSATSPPASQEPPSPASQTPPAPQEPAWQEPAWQEPAETEDPELSRARFQTSARADRWESLAPSRVGEQAPQLPVPDRISRPVDRHQPPPQPVAVSYLLEQLELVGDDAERFESCLRGIFQVSGQLADPDDRRKSWDVISHHDWYANICQHHAFGVVELTEIFGIVVLPELAAPGQLGGAQAEVITRWAYHAPPPMVGGLLGAARKANPETWRAIRRILEPVLAARWAAGHSLADQWDPGRDAWSAGDAGRGEGKRGLLSHFRRR